MIKRLFLLRYNPEEMQPGYQASRSIQYQLQNQACNSITESGFIEYRDTMNDILKVKEEQSNYF